MVNISKLDSMFKRMKTRPLDICPHLWVTNQVLAAMVSHTSQVSSTPISSCTLCSKNLFITVSWLGSCKVNLSDPQHLKCLSAWHSPLSTSSYLFPIQPCKFSSRISASVCLSSENDISLICAGNVVTHHYGQDYNTGV